jgi:hypothetical protein
MRVFLQLNPESGEDLGPDFSLIPDKGFISPSEATIEELLNGLTVHLTDVDTQTITISSLGNDCFNSLVVDIDKINGYGPTPTPTPSPTPEPTELPPAIESCYTCEQIEEPFLNVITDEQATIRVTCPAVVLCREIYVDVSQNNAIAFQRIDGTAVIDGALRGRILNCTENVYIYGDFDGTNLTDVGLPQISDPMYSNRIFQLNGKSTDALYVDGSITGDIFILGGSVYVWGDVNGDIYTEGAVSVNIWGNMNGVFSCRGGETNVYVSGEVTGYAKRHVISGTLFVPITATIRDADTLLNISDYPAQKLNETMVEIDTVWPGHSNTIGSEKTDCLGPVCSNVMDGFPNPPLGTTTNWSALYICHFQTTVQGLYSFEIGNVDDRLWVSVDNGEWQEYGLFGSGTLTYEWAENTVHKFVIYYENTQSHGAAMRFVPAANNPGTFYVPASFEQLNGVLAYSIPIEVSVNGLEQGVKGFVYNRRLNPQEFVDFVMPTTEFGIFNTTPAINFAVSNNNPSTWPEFAVPCEPLPPLLLQMGYDVVDPDQVFWATTESNVLQTITVPAGLMGAEEQTIQVTLTNPTITDLTTEGAWSYNILQQCPYQNPNGLHGRTNWDAPKTWTFSQPVTNPTLALYSVGQPGVVLIMSTDADWGVSYTVENANGLCSSYQTRTIRGAEGYGMIQFVGVYDSITIQTTQPENWTNYMWGIVTSEITPNQFYGCDENYIPIMPPAVGEDPVVPVVDPTVWLEVTNLPEGYGLYDQNFQSMNEFFSQFRQAYRVPDPNAIPHQYLYVGNFNPLDFSLVSTVTIGEITADLVNMGGAKIIVLSPDFPGLDPESDHAQITNIFSQPGTYSLDFTPGGPGEPAGDIIWQINGLPEGVELAIADSFTYETRIPFDVNENGHVVPGEVRYSNQMVRPTDIAFVQNDGTPSVEITTITVNNVTVDLPFVVDNQGRMVYWISLDPDHMFYSPDDRARMADITNIINQPGTHQITLA